MQSGLVLLLAGMEALGEWMARGGDDAVFTQEVVSALGASADLEVDVWTKSADDTGPGTKVVESTDWSAISGTGFKTVEVNGEIIDWDDNGGGGMTLRITVYTKDAEDAGHGEVVKDQAGTSELELILDPAAANPTKVKQLLVQALDGATGEWIQIRLFAPVFFDRAAKP